MSVDRRSLLKGLLACGCCAAAGASFAEGAGHGGGVHWSYEGEGAPDKWGDLQSDYKVCRLGAEQTPIDLVGGIKGEPGTARHDYKPMPLRIVNNGHTIQVNADPGSSCTVDGVRYELLQFHFHHPSEHLMAGKRFEMECHFVHKSASGTLAVTGVLIRPGAENAALKGVFDQLPAKAGAELRANGTIEPAAVLPTSGGFFRYMGSLTTPPCSEGLTWTVFKEPIELSPAQIQRFAALFPNNARPAQRRNRRFLIDAS
ncbi:carbonic anhydrase [Rhodopseudomonas thermotolerans]|uniref:carbonic anhydrase n=2 Tax=Rhodopseudomonas TaxID=1073 RepID=A0A336JV30_9BRAD|nr:MULTISPECIES: carbonic anhydrase family protein [Rhodopseudomonas]RED21409.1 carbonic anhydrase [Rhodopseudomonas pentothenatexigens]REF86896.1 carbonic anhydrase [Rhodopseudomonas thermotolerans]SSW93687.1 carbonic anhydrase [Rhodopseudomonas pentothenatexigens]